MPGHEGLLKSKTRVLVTHGITYLPKTDYIIVMKDGRVSEQGTYQDLVERKGDFAEFLIEYMNEEDQEEIEDIKVKLFKQLILLCFFKFVGKLSNYFQNWKYLYKPITFQHQLEETLGKEALQMELQRHRKDSVVSNESVTSGENADRHYSRQHTKSESSEKRHQIKPQQSVLTKQSSVVSEGNELLKVLM